MGLDMYLEEEIYIGGEYNHRNVTGTIDLYINNEPVKITPTEISTIIKQAAYWRKANAIHNWFVQEIQDGVDECQRSYVSKEKLTELVTLCKESLEIIQNTTNYETTIETDWQGNKFEYTIYNVNLPLTPVSGFFFGSTKVDTWFVKDLEYTIEALTPLLDSNNSIYYQASW